MPKTCSLALLLLLSGSTDAATQMQSPPPVTGDCTMHQRTIGPFSREEAPRHQSLIQAACDEGLEAPRTFVFAPGEYYLSDPAGIRVPGDSTVVMHGARFVFAKDMADDGQAFLVENASNLTFLGGEIVGQRDSWNPGVNIAGIRALGDVHDLTVAELRCANLSSNAVGVFGASDDNPIRDVTLRNVVGINCCNFYGDYLSDKSGPAPGSDRKDQGTVALYHVNGWLVTGCRFERSQSDGTHFFHAHNGRFVDSVVADSQMGGYFLEGCEHVLASGNIVQGNGSRGVTIERDSRFCTLQNNVVAFSGREGLWAPDVEGIIVPGNIFRENGRKDDGERDCEIRLDDGDRYSTRTTDIRVEGNVFCTKAHQTAAVFVGPGVEGFSLGDNTFRGEAPPTNTGLK